jgi:alginate O-acetyltransferase complex protein AlgI
MLFTSFTFGLLVLVTFVLYYLVENKRSQTGILILSSLFFYAFDSPKLVVLLLISASINVLSSYYVVYGNPQNRKLYATLGVVLNLIILLFFKYSPLFATSFLNTKDGIGQFLMTIPLPIGISFFTFQGISLIIDVYREKYFKSTDLIENKFLKHAEIVLFFKAFFPQLISGPIVKAHEFLPQINIKKIKEIDWQSTFKFLVVGYFLKMVVADNLKDFTSWISYPYFQYQWSVKLIVMLYGYSCQIFADFAGYSLIAIGLAKLFGYDFKQNFNFPYISTSFSEFWQRWHISLSSFLKEYLYIPLGGNKKGKTRTYFNLMITMILGGLWHGAAWSYAVWGLFHGLALAIERLIDDKFGKKSDPGIIVRLLKGLLVFIFVTMAWLLFKLPNFDHVILYIGAIKNNWSTLTGIRGIPYIILYSLPVVLYHFLYLMKKGGYFSFEKYEYLFYGIMLFAIIVNSGSTGEFIYFQF